ncbi:type II toxin-antitoxin system PemK/MazF family toxin [Fusibacter sp. 3D3]|uniref:type II toxin-antitoxin system PemK/MazF family toxin n=1 Tax=Fusibacter sp. 3D3 TaxID=1048380 RepID=UPI000852B527|nr:type II toxin-antitoxin system PemK/MazF family toxin [Fusibacter sp. 3D3]
MYKQGDILLVPIPFLDLTATKRRPVLVISNAIYNSRTEDIIVSAITSNIRGTDFEIVFDAEDMLEGNLPKISCIRPDKIYTLSKNIIVKKYGVLSQLKVSEVSLKSEEIISN